MCDTGIEDPPLVCDASAQRLNPRVPPCTSWRLVMHRVDMSYGRSSLPADFGVAVTKGRSRTVHRSSLFLLRSVPLSDQPVKPHSATVPGREHLRYVNVQIARCELRMHHSTIDRSAIAPPVHTDASSVEGSRYELDGHLHRHSICSAAIAVHDKFLAESMLEREPSKHQMSWKMLTYEQSEDL